MNIKDLFKNLATAKIAGRGTYMSDGLYEVETKAFQAKKGEDPLKPNAVWFICEFTIVESSNPEKHPKGSSGSYILNFSNIYTQGNIKELGLALLGYENTKANQEDADIGEKVEIAMSAACGDPEAAANLEVLRQEFGPTFGNPIGVRLKLETKQRPTKASGNKPAGVFTGHKWAPVRTAA